MNLTLTRSALLVMRKCLVFIITFLGVMIAQAAENPASATINVSKSTAAIDVLSSSTEIDKKPYMAKTMESNLDQYTPPALIWLGNYFLSQKDYSKAALYFHLGLLRASIDTKASGDPTLKNVVSTLQSWIQNNLERHLTADERQHFVHAYKSTTNQVIDLDQKTERNYDIRWASIHSKNPPHYVDKKEYQKIVDEEYQQYRENAKKEGSQVD